uniref:Putative retroelement putative n=1 Tax=Albugo laibachii Nc14 TaxID=890382 RepID=F0W625_9STRA|nr:Putative retroelement putative [Albugo laibachii Nc14]|eukprot:CCA16567.1 Putative retroelement putative [Albugo laibachii Nc14]
MLKVVSMDFVVGLPVSKGYDAILTVVDKLSKHARYIPTHTMADAAEVARTFFDGVIRHHGLPQVIISARDPIFTSKFWRSLMQLMGLKLSMTTAHRAQSDGQTERQNLLLKDALRCMVSYHGNHWVNHLGTIEYAHATLISTSTKLSSFQIDTGRQPYSVTQTEVSTPQRPVSIVEYAQKFVEERKQLIQLARKNLLGAQTRQKKYYDKQRREVEFHERDKVLLDTRHLPLKVSATGAKELKSKLAAKRIGPFRIIEMISQNVAKFHLPPSLSHLHLTFNIITYTLRLNT